MAVTDETEALPTPEDAGDDVEPAVVPADGPHFDRRVRRRALEVGTALALAAVMGGMLAARHHIGRAAVAARDVGARMVTARR